MAGLSFDTQEGVSNKEANAAFKKGLKDGEEEGAKPVDGSAQVTEQGVAATAEAAAWRLRSALLSTKAE